MAAAMAVANAKGMAVTAVVVAAMVTAHDGCVEGNFAGDALATAALMMAVKAGQG